MLISQILVGVAWVLLMHKALADPVVPGWIAKSQGWTADAKTGCRAWNQNPEPGETIEWKGACKDGLVEGSGTLTYYTNGQVREILEGKFRGGKVDGYGVIGFHDGTVYMGGFREGVADGAGVLVTKDGITVRGNWVNGRFQDGTYSAAVGRAITDCPQLH